MPCPTVSLEVATLTVKERRIPLGYIYKYSWLRLPSYRSSRKKDAPSELLLLYRERKPVATKAPNTTARVLSHWSPPASELHVGASRQPLQVLTVTSDISQCKASLAIMASPGTRQRIYHKNRSDTSRPARGYWPRL